MSAKVRHWSILSWSFLTSAAIAGSGCSLFHNSQPVAAPVRMAPKAAPETLSYTVVPGDTLMKISQKTLGRRSAWQLIARANPELSPSHIVPGQILRIPSPVRGTSIAMNSAVSTTVSPIGASDDSPFLSDVTELAGDTTLAGNGTLAGSAGPDTLPPSRIAAPRLPDSREFVSPRAALAQSDRSLNNSGGGVLAQRRASGQRARLAVSAAAKSSSSSAKAVKNAPATLPRPALAKANQRVRGGKIQPPSPEKLREARARAAQQLADERAASAPAALARDEVNLQELDRQELEYRSAAEPTAETSKPMGAGEHTAAVDPTVETDSFEAPSKPARLAAQERHPTHEQLAARPKVERPAQFVPPQDIADSAPAGEKIYARGTADDEYINRPAAPPQSARAALATPAAGFESEASTPAQTRTARTRDAKAKLRATSAVQNSESMFYSCHAERCSKRHIK